MDFRGRPETRSAPLIMTAHPQSRGRREISCCRLPLVICLYCSKKSYGEQLLCSRVIRSLQVSLCLPGNCAHWQSGVCSPFQMEDKVRWYIENYVHVIQSVRWIFSAFHFWQAALYPGNSLHRSVAPKTDSVFLAWLLRVFTERDQWRFSEHQGVDNGRQDLQTSPAWRGSRKVFLDSKPRWV